MIMPELVSYRESAMAVAVAGIRDDDAESGDVQVERSIYPRRKAWPCFQSDRLRQGDFVRLYRSCRDTELREKLSRSLPGHFLVSHHLPLSLGDHDHAQSTSRPHRLLRPPFLLERFPG